MTPLFLSYVLYPSWIATHQGWSALWRWVFLGFLAINSAITVAIAFWRAAPISFPIVFTTAGAILVGPGFVFGHFLRALIIRVIAVLSNLPEGLPRLAKNWVTLITKTDFRTEPELVPGTDYNSFRYRHLLKEFWETKEFAYKLVLILTGIVLFLPSYFYRLVLKSTFVFYWPLLFISTAPSVRKTVSGGLKWDQSQGRGPDSWIYLAVASGTAFSIGYGVYDPTFYSQFAAFAESRGFQPHSWTMMFGLQLQLLDIWGWSALVTCGLTVCTTLWAFRINARLDYNDEQPVWVTLKLFYALTRLKLLLVTTTVMATLYIVVWFVHDSCTLPHWLEILLGIVFGEPHGCIKEAT